jgi:epoxyqueuosine reductase
MMVFTTCDRCDGYGQMSAGLVSTLRNERTANVKSCASKLGFDACGIAATDPIDPDNRLGDWLAKGYHADMDWIVRTRDLRQNVALKLPGARSVVVVARNYYWPKPIVRDTSTAGKVARYAWGRDYHRVLRKPLRALAGFLDALEDGAQSYCSIDSGPVMERTWAQRAGVGWIGKNALVIRQGLGSWFFLGVVATTVELEPDQPAVDCCGSCRLCLDACPTQAIVEARVVDSRRCISYQTIENRGEIPPELRPKLDNWIFGCDICQEVCPWNRKTTATTERDFLPRDGQTELDLNEIHEIPEASFHARFAGTPLMRAKHQGLVRNANALRKPESSETLVPKR